MKRALSVVLAALLVVGVAPPPALAAVPPVATPLVDTTHEDVPVEVTLEAADVDGGAIVSFQTVGGSAVLGAVGTPSAPDCTALPTCTATVTFTPTANVSGIGGFSFTATDNQGDTSLPATVTITVTPVNDPPTAVNDTLTVAEDSGQRNHIDVLGNDSSAPDGGEALTVAAVGRAEHGTTALHKVFGVRYQPAANYNGTDSFTYTISDGVLTATATVNVTVTSVNDPPVAITDTPSVAEDSVDNVINVLANDTTGPDDGEVLSVTAVTQPPNGTTTLVSGVVRYTPDTQYAGTDTFTYTLSDGTASVTGTVNVTITGANDDPTANNDTPAAILEDAAATVINVLANDSSAPDTGETLTVTGVGNAAHGTTSLVSGVVRYQPAVDYNGADAFTYAISDGNGGTDTATVTIAVTAVNDPPSFTKGADPAVLEDAAAQTITGWATAIATGPADEAGQTVTFAVTNNTNAALFSVQPAIAVNGTLTYTPAANANGSATVTIQLTDNGGTANGGDNTSDAQAFTITVTAVNDVPSFTKGPDQTDFEDAGAQTVTPWATVISRGPANEAAQTLSFGIVSNTNTALFSTQPAIAANGTLSYTPAANAHGTATIEVRLVDSGGTANGGQDSSGTQSFSITVTSVNDAPSFTRGADQLLLEDAGAQTVAGWATGMSAGPADEAGQSLAFQIASNTNAALFSVQPAIAVNGTLTYTPAANASGTATVQVRITDNGGTAAGGVNASAIQTLAITIAPVNDAPTFTKGADQGAPEDAALQKVIGWATGISAGPADESAQALAFEIIANTNPDLFAIQPAIEAATGTLTYDPATNRTGTTTIEVRLTDNGGVANGGDDTSATQTFTITVAGANDPPIAANDLATVRLGGPTAINVRANDSGGPNEAGDSYLITAIREGSRGTVTITGGGTGLTYDPLGCTTGTDTFSYTLTDGGGQTDTATVLVTLANPSPYPMVDGPRPFFVTNSTIGSTTPIKLTWCGLTSGTTIKGYRLYQSRSSGAFTTLITSTTSRSSTRSLSGSPTTYQFKARVTDNKGRIAYGAGPRFRVLRYQDASSFITYSSGWSKSSTSSALGGTTRYTKSAGKSAQLTYTGRSFAIVGTKGSTRGSFNVYVDGARVNSTAVSTRTGSTLYRRVLYQRSMPFGIHTVKIVAVGNGRIDLDAILAIAAG